MAEINLEPLKVLYARNFKSNRWVNVMLKFGSSSSECKSRNKSTFLNTVRFKCFLSFKAIGEKRETGGERRRRGVGGDIRREETGGEHERVKYKTGGDRRNGEEEGGDRGRGRRRE